MSSVGHKVERLSRVQIRQITEIARQIYGLGDGPIDVLQLLEHYVSGEGVTYDIVSDAEMERRAAVALPQRNLIAISESVYALASKGDPDAQFIIAHELGHIGLGHCVALQWGPQITPPRDSMENSEKQADVYAEELLMPAAACKRCKSEREIEEKFNVTRERATLRWHNINIEG